MAKAWSLRGEQSGFQLQHLRVGSAPGAGALAPLRLPFCISEMDGNERVIEYDGGRAALGPAPALGTLGVCELPPAPPRLACPPLWRPGACSLVA